MSRHPSEHAVRSLLLETDAWHTYWLTLLEFNLASSLSVVLVLPSTLINCCGVDQWHLIARLLISGREINLLA